MGVAGANEAVVEGEDDGCCTVSEVELGGDVADVGLDGAHAKEEVGGDFAIGQFFGKPVLIREGKTVVVAVDDGLAFRLGRTNPVLSRLDPLPGVHVFEPCTGRPFHDWRVIPHEHTPLWEELVVAVSDATT